MSMVRYQILGNNGWTAFVSDYCFRGLSSHTPVGYIREYSLLSPEGKIYEEEEVEYDEDGDPINNWDERVELFENIRDSIKEVSFEVFSYRTDVVKELKQLVSTVPWLRDVVTYKEGNRDTTFTVRGDIEGDHLFHALSTMRNIEMHMWSSYMSYRESYTPAQALNLLMFSPKVTDFSGQVQYVGYHYTQDYMWANFHTVTRGSVKSVIENGPRWFLKRDCLDYYDNPLPFTPTISGVERDDKESVQWSSSTFCRLFRSFELPVELDEDPVIFDTPKDMIEYAEELI